MKKTLLIFVSALFAFAVRAASYDIVSVDLTDGSKVDIALSERLALNFNATHLLVSGTDADCEIPKEKIVAFTHSGKSAIDEISADTAVDLKGRTMHFKGLASGSVISVFDLSGKCLLSAAGEGDYLLGLDELPSGVYVVAVNNVSYKITLK